MHRRILVVVLVLPWLLAAAPTTVSSASRPANDELQKSAFWRQRAAQEWARITDAQAKPWKTMAEQQRAAGDEAGLRRTLAELKALLPRLQRGADRDYHLAWQYVGFAGTFATLGDEASLELALDMATQPGWEAYQSSSLRQHAALSLVRAGRDKDGLVLAEVAEDRRIRLHTFAEIAKIALADGRLTTAKEALREVRRVGPEIDREGGTYGRLEVIEALADARAFAEATRFASSLPPAARANADSVLAAAYASAGQPDQAAARAQAAIESVKKARWNDPSVNMQQIAQRLARVGDAQTIRAVVKLADEAKGTPLRPAEREAMANPPAGLVMLTPGQRIAIDCHAGLALGLAMNGNGKAAPEQLQLAEAVIRAADPKPLTLTWYQTLHLPVVNVLLETNQAEAATSIVKTFPKHDLRPNPGMPAGNPILADLKRTAATAFEKAGDVTQATAMWRELGESQPLLLDHRVKSGDLPALFDAIQARPLPVTRCLACLEVAAQLSKREQVPSSTSKASTRP